MPSEWVVLKVLGFFIRRKGLGCVSLSISDAVGYSEYIVDMDICKYHNFYEYCK